MLYYRALIVIAGLSLSSTALFAATASSTTPTTPTSSLSATVNSNGEINTQAAQTDIQKQIQNNNVLQQDTGIYKTDPDSVVAAGVAAGQNNAPQNSTLPSGAVRATNGVADTQSQRMLHSLDTSASSSPVMTDPDAIAAEQTAQSVGSTPPVVNNPTTTGPNPSSAVAAPAKSK